MLWQSQRMHPLRWRSGRSTANSSRYSKTRYLGPHNFVSTSHRLTSLPPLKIVMPLLMKMASGSSNQPESLLSSTSAQSSVLSVGSMTEGSGSLLTEAEISPISTLGMVERSHVGILQVKPNVVFPPGAAVTRHGKGFWIIINLHACYPVSQYILSLCFLVAVRCFSPQ